MKIATNVLFLFFELCFISIVKKLGSMYIAISIIVLFCDVFIKIEDRRKDKQANYSCYYRNPNWVPFKNYRVNRFFIILGGSKIYAVVHNQDYNYWDYMM